MNDTVTTGVSRARLDRIDEAMQRCIDTTPIPGIVTLLYRRGELLYHKAFGVLGPDGEPMRPDAIFRIHSMTKPIVCAALLTLYEEGAFRLTDPVARFIPEFAQVRVYAGPEPAQSPPGTAAVTLEGIPTTDPLRAVTVHDLLTHSAGLTYPWMEYGPVEELYRRHVSHLSDQPLADLVRQIAALPLAFPARHPVPLRAVPRRRGTADRGDRRDAARPLSAAGHLRSPGDDRHRLLRARRRAAPLCRHDRRPRPRRRHRQPLAQARRGRQVRMDLQPPDRPGVSPPPRLPRWPRAGVDRRRLPAFLRHAAGRRDPRRHARPGARDRGVHDRQSAPGSAAPVRGQRPCAARLRYDGLGVRVLHDPARSRRSGSVGEYSLGGGRHTYFWVDPVAESIAIFLAQIRPAGYFRVAEEFRELAYQALVA